MQIISDATPLTPGVDWHREDYQGAGGPLAFAPTMPDGSVRYSIVSLTMHQHYIHDKKTGIRLVFNL